MLYSWKEWPKPRVTFSKAEKADKGAVYEEGVSEDYSYRDRKFLCTKEQYYGEICYYLDICEVPKKKLYTCKGNVKNIFCKIMSTTIIQYKKSFSICVS